MSKRSFEEAMMELEHIVDQLENGELSLEESLDFFQKGIEISRYCSKKLDEIEKQISILVEDEEGNIQEKELAEDGA